MVRIGCDWDYIESIGQNFSSENLIKLHKSDFAYKFLDDGSVEIIKSRWSSCGRIMPESEARELVVRLGSV